VGNRDGRRDRSSEAKDTTPHAVNNPVRRPGVQFASNQLVRAWFLSVLGYFLTPAGVVLLGALDASLVFFLPLGIDFVVIVRRRASPTGSGCTRCSRRWDRSPARPARSGSASRPASAA
jgi:hypothetical protein